MLSRSFLAVVILLPGLLFSESGVQDQPLRGVRIVTADGHTVDLYSGSYALLVGNSQYEHWDNLEWPARDVDEIAEELRWLGFETEIHKNVSEQEFREITSTFLATHGREEDAQLLVYYAGHGHTERGALDRSFGYIVMTNTPQPLEDYAGFEARSISMQWFLTYARRLQARHVLFVFDSCFSGSVLNVRSQATPEAIQEFVAKPVREFLTAGSEDEPVPDRSVFKMVLMRILQGEIQEPIQDGHLTGEELGLLMKRYVPEYCPYQHPQYGKILDPELDEGDFVFVLADPDFREGKKRYDAGDYLSALAYFETSAEAGNNNAMYYAASIHFEGRGVERDYERATEWFRQAADAGNARAMLELGTMYMEGTGVEMDATQAVRWLDEAARMGEPGALAELGVMHRIGDSVPQDYDRAFGMLLQAARLGNAKAMNHLADLYIRGLGVERNDSEALQWYERAMDAGDSTAMYNLGCLYFEGNVVRQDLGEALRLYQNAANFGNASAMNSLGHMHREGLGVPRDFQEAKQWFLKAAEAGSAAAMNQLGNMHKKGLGFLSCPAEPDAQEWVLTSCTAMLMEAIDWYERGAEAGEPEAMFNLGRLYEEGLGLEQDLATARFWYTKAAQLGCELAKIRLKEMRPPT